MRLPRWSGTAILGTEVLFLEEGCRLGNQPLLGSSQSPSAWGHQPMSLPLDSLALPGSYLSIILPLGNSVLPATAPCREGPPAPLLCADPSSTVTWARLCLRVAYGSRSYQLAGVDPFQHGSHQSSVACSTGIAMYITFSAQ